MRGEVTVILKTEDGMTRDEWDLIIDDAQRFIQQAAKDVVKRLENRYDVSLELSMGVEP